MRSQRSARVEFDLARYYIINTSRNRLVDKHCDPEALGRELGALAEYEHMVSEFYEPT
jgi:hypothetical protein